MEKFLYKSWIGSHLFKRLLHSWVNRNFDAGEGVQDMSEVSRQLHIPQEADLVIKLDGGDSLGEVCHNALEELVMNGETDKQLKLVVLPKTIAGGFYPGDQPS